MFQFSLTAQFRNIPSYEDLKYILNFIISDLKALPINNKNITAAITYLMRNQESLLQFVQGIDLRIKDFAVAEKIDSNSLFLMWDQLKYPVFSKQYNDI